jgi:hypothetical protein
MMMPTVTSTVAAVAAVSAGFGLEGRLQSYQISAESTEHVLDHMVGPNAENLVSNFSRQMPISQMPGKPGKLVGIFVPDFHNELWSGVNFYPSAIFKLQSISIGHRYRFLEIENDILTLVTNQPDAAAMARVKIECESARRFFFRPMAGRAMNGSGVGVHIST